MLGHVMSRFLSGIFFFFVFQNPLEQFGKSIAPDVKARNISDNSSCV